MSTIPDRIEDDVQYNEILARIVKGAQAIEDPLATDDERARYMRGYDKLCALVTEYRTRGG